MNYMFGWQPKAGSNFGVTGIAAFQLDAGLQQFPPGSTMDGAIHSATATQRLVGSIYNGIHIQRGNVVFDEFDTIVHILFF
jgi:hypothetical protein